MKKGLASLVLLAALAAPAFGQGCAMCYTGAEASGSKSQKALDHAILVMLIPTLTFIAGFVGIAYAYRNPREDN
jgi:hypothetical protein